MVWEQVVSAATRATPVAVAVALPESVSVPEPIDRMVAPVGMPAPRIAMPATSPVMLGTLAIDALPEVVDMVAGRVPILIDGGIQRGTDVLKAIAIGATAVMIGRPYCFALAVAGAEGVRRSVEILRNELEMALMLVGRPRLKDVDRSVIW